MTGRDAAYLDAHAPDPRRRPPAAAVAEMPRGGPHASWLDRRLETTVPEYTDRADVSENTKRKVIEALDRYGRFYRQHQAHAHTALASVSDIPAPRILELGAGHGTLSANIVKRHPTATMTVSDVDPASVARIAASPLGSHPRVRAHRIDATAIAADDDSYDLAVMSLGFHHLPPATAATAIAEATRVAGRFLVIDIKRPAPLMHLLQMVSVPAFLLGLAAVTGPSRAVPAIHDWMISSMRSYGRDGFVALGEAADPYMDVQFLPPAHHFGPKPVNVLFAKR
ncbi:class I SAM-dependent methyltransferase [Mycolicibacterium farcinogenes]|nr:class I SAM-dependent methyltransferase [Mycolicibacterium farcinogenes]